jgi:hypothetical protein
MKLDWELLYNDESVYFPRLLQFGEVADSRFRYGINELIQHSLYFYFPNATANRPVEVVSMANLSFHETITEGKPTLVLTLLNKNLKNLFDDLIISLVIQTHQKPAATKGDFISICNEWFELFDPLSAPLSKAEVQGIFAEVYFLQYLLKNSTAGFNDILRSWQGPFGRGHDFQLGDNLFEIKSRVEGVPFVHISSEYQLDCLAGQNLFLSVCEFKTGTGESESASIGQLILETAAILRTQTGINMSLFWTALGRLKLSYNALDDYNEHLFTLKSVTNYNCTAENFPAIRRSQLPDAVRNLKYELALNVLNPFLQADLTPFI